MGAGEVVVVSTPAAEHEVDREVAAIVAVARDLDATAIIAANTATALGWAGAVAITLDLGYAADVTELRADSDALLAAKGVYGGKVIADLELPGGGVVLIRPGAFLAAESPEAPRPFRCGSATMPRARGGRSAPREGVRRRRHHEGRVPDRDRPRRRRAGEHRGVRATRGDDGRHARRITRPIVDAGWVADARQVGQSGKTVAPRVYLAFGISGAVQHLAGLKSAETIIAVNTDPSAAIFAVAQYGATVDMFELAEALSEAWAG